jgi:hypothetical protein
VWDEASAIIKKYLMNTDRRFVVTESTLRESVALFRRYHLSDAEATAELFFVLQAVLRMNPVNIIVYYTTSLTPVLRRLGASIIALRPSGGREGSIYYDSKRWIHFHHGELQGCGPLETIPELDALFSPVSENSPFIYSNRVYRSIREPVIRSRLRTATFPGFRKNLCEMLLALEVEGGHITIYVKRFHPGEDVSHDDTLRALLPFNVTLGPIAYFGEDINMSVRRISFPPAHTRLIESIAALGDGAFEFQPHVTIHSLSFASLPVGTQIPCTGVTLRKLKGIIDQESDIDSDFEFDSDEVVADIMTTKAGIAWNLQRQSIRMSAAFGQGRLGVTLRESAIWGDQLGVIVCGERGENASTMKLLGAPFCAIDISYPDKSWLRPLRTSPRIRWSNHLRMRIHDLVPERVAMDMRKELMKFDPSTIVQDEPGLASGLCQIASPEWSSVLDACADDDLIRCGTVAEMLECTRVNPLITTYVEGTNPGYIFNMPAGSGKTTLALTDPLIFDVDDILAPFEAKAKVLRRRAMAGGSWDELTEMQNEAIGKWIATAPTGFLLLTHSISMVPRDERWRFIGHGKVSWDALKPILSERRDDWAAVTEYNWRTSDFPVFRSHRELHAEVVRQWRLTDEVTADERTYPWSIRYDESVKREWLQIVGDAWNQGMRVVLCPAWLKPACRMFGIRVLQLPHPSVDGYLNRDKFQSVHLVTVLRDWKFHVALARSYRHGTMVSPAVKGVNIGFRVYGIGKKMWRLHDDHIAHFHATPEWQSWGILDWPVRVTLLLGCFLRENFLQTKWINRSHLHRVALFSLSNIMNPRDAWIQFTSGTQNWTFNYLNPRSVSAFVKSSHPSRVLVTREGRNVVKTRTDTATWIDRSVDTSTIVVTLRRLGYTFGAYTHPDFLMLANSHEDLSPRRGFQHSSNPRDGFMNCWITYSTLMSPGAPWPDQMNTQTWWVKVPTAALRMLHHEDADTQRLVRSRAVEFLTPDAVRVYDGEAGHHYGWLPEYQVAVDPSGHAISMMIMAGFGVVDIGRYWDTVLIMMDEHFRTGRKDPKYKQLIKMGNLTEDAVHNPFKLWHTIWDYRASVYAYVLMGDEQRIPLHPRLIQYSLERLNAYERVNPSIRVHRRKDLDARIRNLYMTYRRTASP